MMNFLRLMFISFLCLNVSFANTNSYSNIDKIIAEIYNEIGSEKMDKVFIDREHIKKELIKINDIYDINLHNVVAIRDLNQNMQAKLIRPKNSERSDIINNKYDFNDDELFKSNDNKVMITKPIVLGGFYDSMKNIVKDLSSNKKLQRDYIFLTSDRPFVLEDFDNQNNKEDLIFEMLCHKNKKFTKFKKEVLTALADYNKDKKHDPLTKKAIFYVKLISLVDKEAGKLGRVALLNLAQSHDKNDAKKSLIEFIYLHVTTQVPNEYDMALYIAKTYKIENYVIIETKTKYKMQNRATTMDTYIDFINYIKQNKINISDFTLVNKDNYVYRQWLELVFLLDKQYLSDINKYPNFYSVKVTTKTNNDVFVDEFARLFYTINKQIESLPKE